MSSILEEEREILQDLELIENAITKRIRLNPDIYSPSRRSLDIGVLGRKKAAAKGATMIQKHEIKSFINRYKSQLEKLAILTSKENEQELKHELRSSKQGNLNDLDKFTNNLQEILDTPEDVAKNRNSDELHLYDMYSSNTNYAELLLARNSKAKKEGSLKSNDTSILNHKHNIMSAYSGKLKLSDIFSKQENFGQMLDLERFYKMWLVLPRESSLSNDKIPSYLAYLDQIDTFDDSNLRKDTADGQYFYYTTVLCRYLKSFLIKINPLGFPEKSFDQIERQFETEDFAENRNDKIYCKACEKLFSKQTVFNSHLKGKKHKKALTKAHKGEILKNEYIIKELLSTSLSSEFSRTKSEVERVGLLTVRERQFEQSSKRDMNKEQNDYFYTDSDEEEEILKAHEGSKNETFEDEDDYSSSSNIAIGPDGHKIPLWLWKAQGLNNKYRCEICGDLEYHGRNRFHQHFQEPRHIRGLRMLGVTKNFSEFKDLSTIKGVMTLLDKVEKKERQTVRFKESSDEVEDSEGNILSRKAYEQLKKQGLL